MGERLHIIGQNAVFLPPRKASEFADYTQNLWFWRGARRATAFSGRMAYRRKAPETGLLRAIPLQIIMKSTDFFTPVLCKSSVA